MKRFELFGNAQQVIDNVVVHHSDGKFSGLHITVRMGVDVARSPPGSAKPEQTGNSTPLSWVLLSPLFIEFADSGRRKQ